MKSKSIFRKAKSEEFTCDKVFHSPPTFDKKRFYLCFESDTMKSSHDKDEQFPLNFPFVNSLDEKKTTNLLGSIFFLLQLMFFLSTSMVLSQILFSYFTYKESIKPK